MYNEVRVFTHSSIRIDAGEIMYFDPFNIREASHDADIIFVTHEHFDHFSPEDIAKIKGDNTILVCPETMADKLSETDFDEEHIELVKPKDELSINDANIKVIPAYNVGKQFHPKTNLWVGYLVEVHGTSYYIAGDTDINEDVVNVHCDVALLPCGGTYTMDSSEAAKLAGIIAPKLVIPTHYGSVAGEPECGNKLAALLEGKIDCDVRMEN